MLSLSLRVIDHESKNKMGRTNLVSLFAPTLMTVNADAVSKPISLSLSLPPSFPVIPEVVSKNWFVKRVTLPCFTLP